MKALTIFPDAGLNRPTVLVSSAEGTIFLHSPQSRSKPDAEQHYRLNRFILSLERTKTHRSSQTSTAAREPCNQDPVTWPHADCSHTASCTGDSDFPNPTSLLALQVLTVVMPERAQEYAVSKTCQEESVMPCPSFQLDTFGKNK